MKTIGTILIVIGALLLGLGGFIFIRELVFIQTAQQGMAIVTANESVNYTFSQ